METKILSTHTPIISTYPQHASLFSIIDIDQRSLSWIFHNYLSLFIHYHDNGGYGIDFCSQYFPWHKLRFSSCPLIVCRSYDKETLLSAFDLSEFIIKLINTESYVFFFRDVGNGRKHEVLISGYDLSTQKFLCHDFWGGFYGERWMPFEEIKINTNKIPHIDWAVDYLDGIWTLQKTSKYKEKDSFYYETVLNFTISDLIDCLEEHLGYKNNIRKILRKDDRKVGIEIYDIMITMLEKQKKNLVNRPFDIHAFHLLYEHKKLIKLALDNFIDNPFYKEKAILLVKEAEKLRNLVLYCNVSIRENQEYKKYNNILQSITSLKELEIDLFEGLIKEYNYSNENANNNILQY